MKKLIKNIFKKFGYEVRATQVNPQAATGFKLVEFRKDDGTFDYERYKKIQQEANFQKLEYNWVLEANIKFLSDYLKKSSLPIVFGLCHGTRRGNEQKWFRQYLECDVIGTEISDSASQFPHTIQWDFHKPNPDWLGKADFIYSNSFDHSFNPEACLNTWIDSLRIGGICILEHSNLHAPEGANEMDPFGAEIELMPYLITKWGKGRFFVREILDAPEKNSSLKYLQFIVIERRK